MSSTNTTAPKPTATSQAKNQAGILGGSNPSHYEPTNPITLFIIQASLIIIFCRVLHWPLSKIRQPRVIAEVIGGIVLGPTVMGRIPGFSKAIFPPEAMPILNMAANLGLILFLFLVGLETDLRLLKANARIAVSVGGGSMVIPFGLGAGIAVGLYNEFGHDPGTKEVSFGVFVLFIGIAMAITAFPVLARILIELKLLGTSVGVIVLSAGVGNDVVGWILLALSVALINAGSGLTALWVLLCAVGWVLFLTLAVRPAFMYVLRRSGSLDSGGPTQGVVTLTLLMVLASAFFTDVIGVHAIFGGFLIGLICPHEGGFAVRLTEKIEDLVAVIFLPLYFALSGLRTNIGLLNDGIVWAYVIGIIAIAFIGKVAGATVPARMNGLLWRESFAIGSLMQCKGLVELIVLNIGLQAGIISQRVFTMFVVMALVTTFATTPLASALYPLWYQRKVEAWRRGEINWDGTRNVPEGGEPGDLKAKPSGISRVTILLRLDCMASIIALVNLLRGPEKPVPAILHKAKQSAAPTSEEGTIDATRTTQLEVHGLRLTNIGERPSTIMKVSEESEFSERDPVVTAFRTFGRLNNIATAASVSYIPEDSFAETLSIRAQDTNSDLLVVPWSETGTLGDNFEQFIGGRDHRFAAGPHNHFVLSVVEQSTCNTAIFINKGLGGSPFSERRPLLRQFSNVSRTNTLTGETKPTLPQIDHSHHIFFPFVGGADDRAALQFVLHLAKNTNVTATIVHVVQKGTPHITADSKATEEFVQPQGSNVSSDTPRVVRGSIADHVSQADHQFYLTLAQSLPDNLAPRVAFETLETEQPLKIIIDRAKEEVGHKPRNAGDIIVVGRHHGETDHGIRTELSSVFSSSNVASDTKKALGEVADGIIVSNIRASLLVFKAAPEQSL